MITLIHGDDLEKVEKSIIDLTSDNKTVRINGAKTDVKNLEEELLGVSLFGESSIFIIENLFKNKNKKELLQFVLSNNEGLTLILVERGKLNKRDLGKSKFNSVIEHLLPQQYFSFLDGIYPKNGRILNTFYKDLTKTMTAEQIFYSLVKRVRALIAVKTNSSSHSEISRLAPWQLGKLKRQASFWNENDLINFYRSLYDIEKRMKSSQLTMPLNKYIDMTIITELN